MSFSRRLLTTGLAIGLLATACGGDDLAGGAANPSAPSGDTQTITVDSGVIVLASGLATFDTCDALLAHLRTEGAERVGAYGFNDGRWYGPEIMFAEGEMMMMEDDAMEEEAMDDSASSDTTTPTQAEAPASAERLEGADGAVEGVDFSGTNNQEQGVDEPDIVKTDGSRIITLTNGVLTYIEANDGNPIIRGSLNVGWDANEMLISGDRVLLLGMTWGEGIGYPEPFIDDAVEEASTDAEASFAEDSAVDEDLSRIDPGYFGPRVRIIEVDVSDASDPTNVSELLLDGSYLSARMVDGKARVAIQSNPTQLPFVYPQNQNGEERAAQTNREIVAETELDDWVPGYTLVADGEVASTGQLADCSDIHAPEDFAGFGALSVVTVDMSTSLGTPTATAVLAGGQTVYASADTMWLGTNQWMDWSVMSDDERVAAHESFTTQLHGFSITGDTAEYLASGSVRGHMLNQFAMSEHDGVLRVATTDGTQWGTTESSESFITTFEVDGKELRQLGQVGEMGKGERIFSVRFVGDIGYVVTFRQTDPFYTVDLADPSNPTVLGELKITGYSGQLHPIGENHVLGVGQEATDEGRTTGAKVTLFDVSDLSNPIDQDTWTLPNSWTDAEWDHRAFLWWAPENLAILPISNWQEQFWGAIAFRIDTDAGTITEAGRLSHEPAETVNVGDTSCDVLDGADLDALADTVDQDTELFWLLQEESGWVTDQGGQIQLCGDGDRGASGLYCERWDWVDTGDELDGVIEVCWPEGPGESPIMRTLVTGGDTLWSLSTTRLQANDLGSLEAGPFVELD
jgi:hypothetical protein